MSNTRNIVIIGGMGPQASLSLHKRIIERARKNGAANNEDYPLITHLSIPVPDFISNRRKRPEALQLINKSLERLWPN